MSALPNDDTEIYFAEMLRKTIPPNPETPLTTRSVERRIEAGNHIGCIVCGEVLKFVARQSATQIISNLYDHDNKWHEVVHSHPECYDEAGQPFGEPSPVQPKYPSTVARKA